MIRKITVLTLFVAALALIAAPAQAQSASQSATATVNINMPSFLVLYYRSSVTFDLTEAQLAALVGHATNTVDEGSVAGLAAFNDDAGVSGAGFTAPSALTGTLTNFWGVRSVAPSSENTTVTVSVTNGNVVNGASTILLSNAQTRLSGAGAFASNSVTFAPTGLGAGSLQLGDVQFDVDMSGAAISGAYIGGTIQVTAQNI